LTVLQNIGIAILAVLVGWLVFKIAKKLVVAILFVVIFGIVALLIYVKFF
jgi:hypothetical protein